ncbi:TolC family outer membrane protein [Polaromonas sp. YR568]|uniref:TolC family outer membrane protein n=1 Tax=Polaromonas sp. YR568 TaxID=1855301 RepID=UPI003137CF91
MTSTPSRFDADFPVNSRLTSVWLAVAALAFSMAAAAQPASPPTVLTLRDAAQSAVLNNPDVLAKWHSIRAADGERSAAAGALLPRVDLALSGGRERRDDTTFRGNLNRSSTTISISQLLYDGFATRNEVRRLDHARLVRLYEFLDTSEAVAFEAARAYIDVLRFREMVRLAEDNYVEHRAVFAQMERRVKAKVARGVDLEQTSARLSSAEANLLTETANLHDATARFQRVVGMLPAAEMPVPAQLTLNMPADPAAAVQQAQQRNGALLAAVENVRAASSALDSRSGAFGPRVDLRLRRESGRNLSGTTGTLDSNVAEVVLNWNLFAGGADRARNQQFASQLNAAKDQRDKTCRDIRQTLLIAFNDIRKIKEQLAFLDQNKVSLEKARNAYRQQFEIGQRTLLDLLDTENELYQSRRTVSNAEQDLSLAYIRAHAALGTLLTSLDLTRMDVGAIPALDSADGANDVSRQCPPDAVAVYTVNKGVLDERANEQIKQTAVLNARERALQEAAQETLRQRESEAGAAPPAPPSTPPARQPARPPSPSPSSSVIPSLPPTGNAQPLAREAGVATESSPQPSARAELLRALQAWRAAWVNRDIDTYLAAYSESYAPLAPAGSSRSAWEEGLRSSFRRVAEVEVKLSDVTATPSDDQSATTVFTQTYRSPKYQDVVTKTLRWERQNGRWVIVREVSAPQLAVASAPPAQNSATDASAARAVTAPVVAVQPAAAAPAAPAVEAAKAVAAPSVQTVAAGPSAPPASSAVPPALAEALEAWRSAWVQRDVERYLAVYAPDKAPSGSGDRKVWEENRRALISRASQVWIDVSGVEVTQNEPTRATTVFKQSYRSATYQDVVSKTLRWELVDGRWLIVREISAKWTGQDDTVASNNR